jgi:hypothetical protein
MLLMYGQCYHIIRMQLWRPESRYAQRFPERHHPWPRQLLLINLVQRRNRQDRTQNFRKQ